MQYILKTLAFLYLDCTCWDWHNLEWYDPTDPTQNSFVDFFFIVKNFNRRQKLIFCNPFDESYSIEAQCVKRDKTFSFWTPQNMPWDWKRQTRFTHENTHCDDIIKYPALSCYRHLNISQENLQCILKSLRLMASHIFMGFCLEWVSVVTKCDEINCGIYLHIYIIFLGVSSM